MAESPEARVRSVGWRVERVCEATWRTYRDIRLASLIDAPHAFGATYGSARALTDEEVLRRVSGSPYWLALQGERPVGTVGLWANPELPQGDVMLVGMWVAGSLRGSGVATDLVAVVVEHARAHGWRRVVLRVTEGNDRARGLYERLGFRVTGVVVPREEDPELSEAELALAL